LAEYGSAVRSALAHVAVAQQAITMTHNHPGEQALGGSECNAPTYRLRCGGARAMLRSGLVRAIFRALSVCGAVCCGSLRANLAISNSSCGAPGIQRLLPLRPRARSAFA